MGSKLDWDEVDWRWEDDVLAVRLGASLSTVKAARKRKNRPAPTLIMVRPGEVGDGLTDEQRTREIIKILATLARRVLKAQEEQG